MKPFKFQSLFLPFITLFFLSLSQTVRCEPECEKDPGINKHDKKGHSGCTVFTLVKGNQVFFGGNDDFIEPDSWYWVDPGDSINYGVIWIGQPDNVQQGVNEKGLAYDSNGLPRIDVNPHTERIPVPGDYTIYPIRILHECATVDEVIKWVNTHAWHSYMHDQMQFADTTGDAVIISAGSDGELVFTRKEKGDGFLVSTNFNVAYHSNSFGYPCWRYDRATEILEELVNREEKLTVEDAASVLDAVHVEGGTSWTIESMLADLTNGKVYVYYFHQFDRPIVLDVGQELKNPRQPGPLSQLFPEDVRKEAERRYQVIQNRIAQCRIIGIVWASLVLACLIILLVIPKPGRSYRLWLPATILLGPLGLLALVLTSISRKKGGWKANIYEAIGDVTPTVLSFLAYLLILMIFPATQASIIIQIVLILILPIALGWFFFQVPLLAGPNQEGYGKFLNQRLPHTIVVANLGMAGINTLALPLVILSIRICPVMPFSIWSVGTWWAIIVLGSLLGGILISLYGSWAAKRGFRAWSILAWDEGKVQTPSWRKIWWWIFISYIILLGGLAAGAVLQRFL